MSSRDIEGENPLYLPQAKVYDRSSALGPCILVSGDPPATRRRFGSRSTARERPNSPAPRHWRSLKRKPETWLNICSATTVFPVGAFLMTGTGVVPPDTFYAGGR